MTKGLYPLSSQDGKPIPLDVIKPAGLVKFDFNGSSASNIVIPNDYQLCWIYATRECFLRIGSAVLPSELIAGISYDSSIFVPREKILTVLLTPGDAQILGGVTAGTLYINAIEQWAALLQPKQVNIG